MLVGLAAAGCAPPTIIEYPPRVHVVQAGETLNMIAQQHGVATGELARWNRLENPDLIFVGQRLSLTPREAPAVAAVAPPPPPRRAPRAATATPPAAPPPRAAPAPAPPPRQPEPVASPALGVPSWAWPVQGPVVSAYGAGSGTGQGIGIGGEVGQDIRAAASGRVVYAGGGLVGYGQLLIIRHNDTYLSAYGHNDRLVVAEGDTVERGQVIAAMGMGPGRRPQLHFEIRRNGTPVDPLGHLPR